MSAWRTSNSSDPTPGRILPTYPVYVPSKGRATQCYTAKFLLHDRVPFALVVEADEAIAYAERFPSVPLVVLSGSGHGSSTYARNCIADHARATGAQRHWQLDDNIRGIRRWWRGKRIRCASGVALRVTEDFVDRYENVAIAGLNYTMFAHSHGRPPKDPFWLNVHVYSCTLIDHTLPYRWRRTYNEDTDICLQALAGGHCTVLMNAFMCDKLQTMTVSGGNTDDLYHGDGRLRMARSLERDWPGVVETKRRWQRPQHVIKGQWRRFDTQLKLKPGVQLDATPNEYGMQLVQHRAIKSARLRDALQGDVR